MNKTFKINYPMSITKYIQTCPKKTAPPLSKFKIFSQMPLHKTLLRNIRNLKISKPTPIQKKSIPKILSSAEFIGISQTGSGKTLAYLVPLVQLATEGKRSLVVVPTKELKKQVECVRNELCRGIDFKHKNEDLKNENPGLYKNCERIKEPKENGNLQNADKWLILPAEEILLHYQNSNPITVTTPGQIKNMTKKFEIVVLDEMDILIDEFYNDLKMINDGEQIQRNIELIRSGDFKKKGHKRESPQNGNAFKNHERCGVFSKNKDADAFKNLATTQLIGFSATLPSKTNHFFTAPEIVKEKEGLSENLISLFFYVRDNKDQFLLFLLSKFKRSLIFVSNRYTAKYLEELINSSGLADELKTNERTETLHKDKLKQHGYQEQNFEKNKNEYFHIAQSLYSSLDDQGRAEIYSNFTSEKTKFLIVTDIAARGLHLQNLEIMINYDMADDKVFLHRVGRVARNMRGAVFSLVTSLDIHHFVDIKATLYENKTCYLFSTDDYGMKGSIGLKLKDRDNNSLKDIGLRAYKKSLKFRKQVMSQKDTTRLINDLKAFNFDALDDVFNRTDFVKEGLDAKNNLLEGIRKYSQLGINRNNFNEKKGSNLSGVNNEVDDKMKYRDQFYIPYRSKRTRSLHSSLHSLHKD